MFRKAISATAVLLVVLTTMPLAAAERQGRERRGIFERELTKIIRAIKRLVPNEGLVMPKP